MHTHKNSVAFSNLLAVDTATPVCSVAISQKNHLVVESTNAIRQTHSRHLLKMIKNALTTAKIELSDLDGFVVTKGPGSFTGLRIGISTIKGLAKATGKPFIGVSYLECLVRQSAVAEGLVCAIMDARRKEVYYALYRFDNYQLKVIIPESVGTVSHLLAKINDRCLFMGNGIYSNREQLFEKLGEMAYFGLDCHNILKSDAVIWVGRAYLKTGRQDCIESFVPDYIRKSDAQINLTKSLY
jgi:tRNA threonylcarbamoyl adenosine modification protein YeaZ